MDRAGKLYTQISIFLSPDKDTAAALSVGCRKLAEEVAPPSGYTTFQAHMGHYIRSCVRKLAEEIVPPSSVTIFQAHMGHYLKIVCGY